jgi:hypothetical protein
LENSSLPTLHGSGKGSSPYNTLCNAIPLDRPIFIGLVDSDINGNFTTFDLSKPTLLSISDNGVNRDDPNVSPNTH